MKTYRLLAATLLVVALCFNFVSCSKDEEGSNPKKQTKRLTSISFRESDGDKSDLRLDYANDKVIKVELSYDPEIYTYSYSGNTVTEVKEGSRTTNYTLNDDGYVVDGLSTDGSDIWEFGYSGEFLTSMILTYSVTGRKDIDEKFTYNGEGLLTNDSDGYDNIEYTDIPNTGNLFLSYFDNEPLDIDGLFHAGLLGNASKRLPKVAYVGRDNDTFTYELDEDGYVKSCTIVRKSYDDKIYTYTWKGTFTYEPYE